MEARKIAIACFVGGTLFTIVAFWAARALWWLGIPAGIISGYLAYEFRAVVLAVPGAFAAALRESDCWSRSFLLRARDFFRKKHPFAYPTIATISAIFVMGCLVMRDAVRRGIADLNFYVLFFLLTVGAAMLAGAIMLIVLWGLAAIGADFIHVYFDWPSSDSSEHSKLRKKGYPRTAGVRLLHAEGYRYVRVSYINVLCWVPLGVVAIIHFVAWTIPKVIAIIAVMLAWMLIRTFWLLIVKVHSHKRLLCGLDGTIGGVLSYWLFVINHWFITGDLSLGERTMIVIFGGLLGAVIGIANWELVSKRLLKVA